MYKDFFNKVTLTISRSAITLTAIVIFFSFPSYDVALLTTEMDPHWDAIFLQAREPFTNHNYLYVEGAHETKLSFRFVPAIILNILNINSKILALIFQLFNLIIFYYLLILNFNKLFENRKKSFLYALPICFIISGHVYTSDYRGIFDTLALDFLLISLYFRNKIFVIFPLLLAYFTDERALIASPGLFILNSICKNNFGEIKRLILQAILISSVYLYTSWMIYFILRFWLTTNYGLATDLGGVNLFYEQFNKSFYTIYVGLEGFIIPFGLILYLLFKKKTYAFMIFFIFYFLLIFWAAQSVYDISRSMSYIILFVIILLVLMDNLCSRLIAEKLIFWVTIINIFSMFSYPLFAQLYRMIFISNRFLNYQW